MTSPPPPALGKEGREQTPRAEIDVTVAEALRSFAFWGSVLAAGDPAIHRAASAVLRGDDSGAPEKRRRLG